jgi:hypothetical protein
MEQDEPALDGDDTHALLAFSNSTESTDEPIAHVSDSAIAIPNNQTRLFCGNAEFEWYKLRLYKGRMHRVVQVSLIMETLDIESFYSGRFLGYHKDIVRGVPFTVEAHGALSFENAQRTLPILKFQTSDDGQINNAEILAEFAWDTQQTVVLTEATCATSAFTEDLASVKRRVQ